MIKTNFIASFLLVLCSIFGISAKALESADDLRDIFAQLKQTPNLKSTDLIVLDKTKSLLIDLISKTGLEADDKARWKEYMSLRDTVSSLNDNVKLQLV